MILYEDHDIIVCHKPAGLPVQSARVGQMDMESMLNNHLAETWKSELDTKDKTKGKNNTRTGGLKTNVQKAPTVYVVHRLDQPVEGVLVFAKTKQAAASLSRQITNGSMRKIYQAVCCVTEKGQRILRETGVEISKEQKEYHLVDYLLKDGRANTSSVVSEHTKNAKRAELSFRVLKLWRDNCPEKENPAPANEYLLAEIELKTGRHHQIRVQMAHAGLPLYGDQKYGNCANTSTTPALCAVSLTFTHPSSGKQMIFKTRPQQRYPWPL